MNITTTDTAAITTVTSTAKHVTKTADTAVGAFPNNPLKLNFTTVARN